MPPRRLFVIFFVAVALLGAPVLFAASSADAVEPAVPLPLEQYQSFTGATLLEILRQRIAAAPFNLVATIPED